MHHNNHKNSTSNHNNPHHQKPSYPSGPAPQSAPKRSVLSRLRERFKEKPATAEEVKQLGLNAKREVYKTAIHKAKSARPGRLDRLSGGFGGGGQHSSRRSSRQDNSGLFGGGSNNSWLMGPSEGPSLDFITGNDSRKAVRNRRQDSGFGKGLEDLF